MKMFFDAVSVSPEKPTLLGPPLKRAGFDGEALSNYCLVSNLPFLSKLTE